MIRGSLAHLSIVEIGRVRIFKGHLERKSERWTAERKRGNVISAQRRSDCGWSEIATYGVILVSKRLLPFFFLQSEYPKSGDASYKIECAVI